jgi:urease accessory protein UreE
MDARWEKIKKSLKEGAALSIEKIEEYAKIGKLKIEEVAARRKIDRKNMDIGERVFDLLETGKSKDIGGDLAVQRSIEEIKSLKEELASIAEKIQTISEEAKKGRKSDRDYDDELTGV